MTEIISNSTPEKPKPSSLEEVYAQISALEPRPVYSFVPLNGEEQKQLFLSGDIRNPQHIYDRLDSQDLEGDHAQILDLAGSIKDFLSEDSIDYLAYSDYANRALSMNEMLQAAKGMKSLDSEVASSASARFTELNKELYGEPDENTYRSLLSETLQGIDSKDLSDDMKAIRAELAEMLPDSKSGAERFTPSAETISNMQGIADYLYGGMFEHIPKDQDSFGPEEIVEIFSNIIDSEFGEAAEGWKVITVKGAAINVAASEKLIKIPENRKSMTSLELRGLIAHEIGVHMMRSVTGGDTDMPILKTGLSNYYDAEEGLGKVMEQASKGEYAESGVPYYTIAGLMHFDAKDFRGTHDAMWRINLLKGADGDAEVTEASIAKAKDTAYKAILRMTRGTDQQAWFKDLAYYNGSAKMWEYCESSSQDPEKLMFLLMGKNDITNDLHRRIMFETKTA